MANDPAKSGDTVKLSVVSPYVYRAIRFALIDGTRGAVFKSALNNVKVYKTGAAPADAQTGRSDPQETAWEDAHLPDDAAWIQVPTKNEMYELTFTVP